jgi:acyl transferase domain-containing protein
MSEQLAQMQELLKKSLVRINQLEAELKSSREEAVPVEREPVAIVGLGCRLPGGIRSLEALWKLLIEKRDAVVPIPADRWDNDAIYDPDPLRPGHTHARSAAFIEEDVKAFDADFFGIVPREAKSIDPLQRMILEVVYEALEEAGIAPDTLKGTNTAVFIAIGNSDYIQARFRSGQLDTMDVYDATGIPFATAAGRVSYLYDLQGTNFALDAACASSVVGLHLAAESLRKGESDTAIVASANLLLTPELFVGLSKLGSLSASGKCKAFADDADGYVRGEGCGVAILRRKNDALRLQDNIHALILGSAVRHDGLSNGFTAPNPKVQLDTIQAALKNAGVGVDDICFVEAHGIGNKFTDAMEIQAIGKGYKGRKQPIHVGSLKPNIGHLEACIGMAMLFKVIGTLKYRAIAPNIYFETPNKDVDWSGLKVEVPTTSIDLTASTAPLRAAINLSGYSGTNVHMIFEEAPKQEGISEPAMLPQLYVWSAKSEQALKDMASAYVHDQNWTQVFPQRLAYTLQARRNHWDYKLSVVADSPAMAVQSLASFAEGKPDKYVMTNHPEKTYGREVAFLFTGQGAQYAHMCKDYYLTEPVFKSAIEECAEILRPFMDVPLLDILFPKEESTAPLIDQTVYTQPALFAVEYALAQLWISRGIRPAAVAGHSIGEFVALCIAGAMTLKDALLLIAIRGKLMQSLPVEAGAMAAVLAGEETVLHYLADFAGQVDIAAINAPLMVTISGEKHAVAQVLEKMKADRVKSVPVTVSHAFHSHLMDPVLSQMEAAAAKVRFSQPEIPVVSNVTGEELQLGDLSPKYFSTHLRNTVRFADDITYLVETLGIQVFLECGPQATLCSFGSKTILRDDVLWLHSARKEKNDYATSLSTLQLLWLAGIPVNWSAVHHGKVYYPVALPFYPWQRKVYWENPVRGIESARLQPKTSEAVLGNPGQTIATKVAKVTKDNIMAIMQLEGCNTLGLHPGEKLDPSKSMREQGFDSMMSGEFLSRMEKYLGVQLEMSLIHTYGTLAELQRHFIDEYLGGGEVDESASAVTMNDIVFGSDMGGSSAKVEHWHEIKETDPTWLKVFKKIDQKISL